MSAPHSPYSTEITFKERLGWAWGRVGRSDVFRSVEGFLIAGLIGVIWLPHDPNLTAVGALAGVGGAVLVFVAQFGGNLFCLARPEILTERLKAAEKRNAKLGGAGERQELIDELAELRANGVQLFARRPACSTELKAWEGKLKEWRGSVVNHLSLPGFTKAERLKFEHLGSWKSMVIPWALDGEHLHLLQMLDRQLKILEEIIDKHTR